MAGLAWFYMLASAEHARVVNDFKARGDQNAYLGDGEAAYANSHGANPPIVYGDRNRMPLYGAYQGLFYDPRLTDPEYFEVAKRWNIRLSLAALALFGAAFFSFLPSHAAANLTLIVAFGYSIFKAGYVQPEVLFYPLFFGAFLAGCQLLRGRGPRGDYLLAATAGVVAALAQLTKASMLPFVVIFLAVYGIAEIASLLKDRDLRRFALRLSAGAVLAACFLAVMYPYISTSKRVFGHYFYNVNTTFYVWYNDWPEASVGTHIHGDGVGWPKLPPDQIPGPAQYWRTHTLSEIAGRMLGGFADMLVRSYWTFWYLKYVVAYLAFAIVVIAARPQAAAVIARAHAAPVAFLLLYGGVYLAAIAFYFPISGTGTARFLLPHLAPLLFATTWFLVRPTFAAAEWRVGAVVVTPAHFHVLVSAMIASDLVFVLWPRLLTTYGGF